MTANRTVCRVVTALVGAIGVGLAPPSFAQERTLGAAHDFIQTMFNDRPQQVTVRRYRGAADETADVSTTRARYAYQRLSDCEGTVWTVSRSHNNISTGIDWSAVSQVDRSETNPRFVRVYGGSRDFGMVAFTLPSEADAARVQTAMEFLRQGCAEASAF